MTHPKWISALWCPLSQLPSSGKNEKGDRQRYSKVNTDRLLHQVLALPLYLLLLLPLSWADVEEVHIQVTQQCREETVKCLESWQCGLTTFTVTTGERVELDCLVENTKMVKKLSWRVSWYYAPGVISSNDMLFVRWHSPRLDLLVLDPVEEEHAGTYRCDVLDANARNLKMAYWGVRVLPRGVLNLDYDHAEGVWELGWMNPTVPISKGLWVIYVMLPLLCIFNLAVMLTLAVMVIKNKGSDRVDDAVCDEETSEGGSLKSESTV
ncbi:transmembrane protein 81 [Dunckerocampus dactyliophorus]|uniref:transmembrane protein 81 n=1 Tax=Dunckerocampus dactyliophorus TaxID=161453 RepID=UPI002405779F|nr:transmembrane protein 81 [Dunckerocampus dactyliophorus]